MIELWYRLNLFAEKQFFKKEMVDGLIVPAHLLAYYEIAMPELLRDCKLPFLIDPVSYVWGINAPRSNEGYLKKSYDKLAQKLDCSLANTLGHQLIQMSKEDSPEFDEFISKTLKCQLLDQITEKEPRRQSIERIKRFKEKPEPKEPSCTPHALIPPYFYFDNVVGNPYNKTLFAAQSAENSSYSKQHDIYPCLCMDKAVLIDQDQLKKILSDFKNFKGINLWVNDFDETKASLDELTRFAELVKEMGDRGTEVINFYGGYFSLMLNYFGVSKMSCGICYSRSRNVQSQPTGGGLPLRYYEPHLKTKIPNVTMIRLYSDMPELFSCSCPVCSEYVGKFKQNKSKENKEKLLVEFFGTPEGGVIDWEKSRLHFLYSQINEKEQLGKKTMDKTIADLRTTYDLLVRKRFDTLKYGQFEHLKLWADSLERV